MNIYSGLLFLQGDIGDADLARSLTASRPVEDADPARSSVPTEKSAWAIALARCRKARRNERLAAEVCRSTALSPFR